jgi:hypothetical protein
MHHHIEGHMALVRESVSHRRMPITVSGQVVPGGRQVVFVDVAPADQWKRGVWSRDVNKTSRTVVSAELDGCVELNPLNADELPVSLVTLGDLLDARNALVVVEGNLVNLQTLCQRALKRCEEIDRSKA